MKYNIIILSILFLFVSHLTYSQVFSDSRKITRSFKVTSSTTVEIINKYGKIHIIPCDKDSVKIEIDISIKSDNLTKYNKLKSEIDFEFTGTEYYVLAKTIVGSKHTSFIDEIKGLREEIIDFFSSSQSEIKINYTVQVPRYVNLKLENKYGDVYTNSFKGNFNLNLSYGDFKANELSGDNEIEINFGDAYINLLDHGKISISYSDFQVKKSRQLTIDSKSSKIKINEIKVLKITSKRDKYHIDKIDDIYGETSFSDIWIYQLNNETSINMRYGNLNLELINKNFSYININSKYADMNLFFDHGSSYNFELIHKSVIFDFPKNLGKITEKPYHADAKYLFSSGIFGTGSSLSKVKISAESGNLNIFHK
ncbi:MAG: hypothetical protein KAT68_14970 [Bacteroidales bacterium]|nr:hypothetical protein [Bacteroidales bacterium]